MFPGQKSWQVTLSVLTLSSLALITGCNSGSSPAQAPANPTAQTAGKTDNTTTANPTPSGGSSSVGGSATVGTAPASDPAEGSTAPIRSDFKPGELAKLCDDAMSKAKAELDEIAAVPPKSRSFDNTVLAFENTTADLSDATTPLTFMGYVSPVASTREEGQKCEEKVGEFEVEIMTRKDLYDAMKDETPRNASERRLLSQTLKGFEDNGLKLPADKLAQVKDLEQQLAAAEAQFNANLNNDNTTVELTAPELAGLPADYVGRLKKTADGSKYIVTTRESDYDVFLNNDSNSEARRKWLLGYYNRAGKANTKLLEKAIGLRQQIATLMGYDNWADYKIHGRMAKDAKTVLNFLNSLKDKLAKRDRSDIAKLLAFKKTLDPSATEVNSWDINYLSYQLQKREYQLDEEKIREYFPADVVVSGMFDVYSQLLGVHFTEVRNAKVWYPDVKLYRINDAKTGRFIGYFYTDFNPRPNKYGHAASFPLISGRVLPNGAYSYPVAAIVANLTAPSDGKPSLLSHDDVVTIFHEFGHIMHQTLTRAPYASLSGANVAQDFVEAPSQMLENWPWQPEILQKLSGYYLDHSKKLPADLLQKMIAARDFNQGYYYTRQVMLALTDMTYHTMKGPVDVTAIYDKLYNDIIGVKSIEGGHFPASFGHLMGGYDAGYYGYLWSEVYAADMFTRFQAGGLLSPKVGADYRRIILEQGNMKDALDLLKEFLGREPNQQAFFKKLHL